MIFQILGRITLLFNEEELRCCPEIIEEQILHHIQYEFQYDCHECHCYYCQRYFHSLFTPFQLGNLEEEMK